LSCPLSAGLLGLQSAVSYLFLASLLFYSRIQNFHDFSTGDHIFPNHMSCQTVGSPTIFSLKDLLYVPLASIHFHLDLVFGSLLYRLYLFKPVFKVLYSKHCNDSGFHYRALWEAFMTLLLSWSCPLAW